MGWMKNISQWNARRYRLIQLRHELEDSERKFKIRTESLQPRSDEYERAYADYRADVDVIVADIGVIETLHSLKTAYYWGAPVPRHPQLPETENEYWSWNSAVGGFHLTSKGLREIRHAVSAERDIYFRPLLAWVAIGISVLSLVVSIFKS